ncbi:IS3 family transposase [Streptomyces griseomycini]
MRTVHRASEGPCDVPGITAGLRENGEVVNHRRVARIMKATGRPGSACAAPAAARSSTSEHSERHQPR